MAEEYSNNCEFCGHSSDDDAATQAKKLLEESKGNKFRVISEVISEVIACVIYLYIHLFSFTGIP